MWKSCYDEACKIARKFDVDIERPRVCGRQVHRQNALQMGSGLSDKQYIRINVTISLLDDILGSLQSRGQDNVTKGIMLLPSSTISESV